MTLSRCLPGQYRDEESGLSYNWWRYYDPTIGRYIGVDPIEMSEDGYVYARNRPCCFADPFGLFPVPCPAGYTRKDFRVIDTQVAEGIRTRSAKGATQEAVPDSACSSGYKSCTRQEQEVEDVETKTDIVEVDCEKSGGCGGNKTVTVRGELNPAEKVTNRRTIARYTNCQCL